MRQTANELAPPVADKVAPKLTVIIPVYSEAGVVLLPVYGRHLYVGKFELEGQNLSHEAFHACYGEQIKDLG